MRQVVSVSLKEETLNKVEKHLVKNSIYRNKSHFIEEAIRRALEGK